MTARALDQLKQYRNELTTLGANRDAVIDGIVQAIMHASNITGQSINILIKSAGISRQTYYLRVKATKPASGPDQEGNEALATIARLKEELAQHDADVSELKEQRAKIIVNIPWTYPATEIAQAAGVTDVWVRVLRRGSKPSPTNAD